MKPLTIFIEFAGPFQWRPGWTSDAKSNGNFRRVWWGWFGLAWVRMDLHDYNRHVASGVTNWKFVPKPAIVVNPAGFAQPPKPPPPQYRCVECGHVCAVKDMEADCADGGDDDIWSSYICPKCQHWHPCSTMVGRRSIRLDLQRFSRDNNSEPEPEMKDMTPVAFPQVNVTYQPPSGATDIAPLPAYSDGRYAVSCWRLSFCARVKLLFTGSVWFSALAVDHPPVKLSVKCPFVPTPKPVVVSP